MTKLSKTLATITAALLLTIGLTGCATELDPAEFEAQITIGTGSTVIAGEIYEVVAELAAPEGISATLFIELQRRAVGEEWSTIAEQRFSAPPFALSARDKIDTENIAEYRLVATEDGSESSFFIGPVESVEALSEQNYLSQNIRPELKLELPENVAANMLVDGDEINLSFGFESDSNTEPLQVDLVAIDTYGTRLVVASETSSAASASFNFGAVIIDPAEINIDSEFADVTKNHEYQVEIRRQVEGSEAVVRSESVTFTSHSITQYINNLFDALNFNCELDGEFCIESHEWWAGPFVDIDSDHWQSWASGFAEENYTVAYALNPDTIQERTAIEYDSPCMVTPKTLAQNPTNRYFNFDANIEGAYLTGRYDLLGNLYDDGSVVDFALQPVMCWVGPIQ